MVLDEEVALVQGVVSLKSSSSCSIQAHFDVLHRLQLNPWTNVFFFGQSTRLCHFTVVFFPFAFCGPCFSGHSFLVGDLERSLT